LTMLSPGTRPDVNNSLSLHDALPILKELLIRTFDDEERLQTILGKLMSEPKYPEQLPEPRDDASWDELEEELQAFQAWRRSEFADRKSTRLNSSHVKISYAVFCLKKK